MQEERLHNTFSCMFYFFVFLQPKFFNRNNSNLYPVSNYFVFPKVEGRLRRWPSLLLDFNKILTGGGGNSLIFKNLHSVARRIPSCSAFCLFSVHVIAAGPLGAGGFFYYSQIVNL
jgi:hypothetical protein